MRNYKGFILPLTMMVIFLLMGFFLSMVVVLDSDRHFLLEQQHINRFDQLDEMMVVDINRMLSDQVIPPNQTFNYPVGSVELSVSTISGTTYTYRVITKESSGYTKTGYLFIDTKTYKIVRWMEGIK